MSETESRHWKILHKRTLERTVAYYVLFACLWIYFSDTLLAWFVNDTALLTKTQTFKGWLFVVVTATLLYLYLGHSLRVLRKSEEAFGKEQDKARREILDRFKQLNTLFDSMSALIYVADLETNELLYVNRFATEFFGPDWQERKCYHYLQDNIDQPCDFCTNSQLIKNGESGATVIWEFLNTRNKRWYECFDKVIRWTDGRLVRLEVALDITERKAIKKIKDDLLSSMSHEMRTPLTAISGFAELLRHEPEIPEQHSRHIEIIYRETEKLTDLINRFLDVRRLKSERSRINYEHLPVKELLIKAKDACRERKEHHDLEIDCQANLHIYGNRRELTQVLTQILENACRYSPKGGTISLAAHSMPKGITIHITDQGIGIPQHELEAIFLPFHRLDTGDSRRTGSVGLGLCVAKDIIALHGGHIQVESTPDIGSTFTILLPQSFDSLSLAQVKSPGPMQS